MRLISAGIILAVLSIPAFAAQPTDPVTTAVFAGGNLTFNGFNTVNGGAVVSNGNVLHDGGTLTVPSMYAGGTFTRTPASFQNTAGEILFGGDITDLGGPGSVIGGDVTSGGSVALLDSSQTVNGNVTARFNVSQPFSISAINGNILAGGNVNIQGTVNGSVAYGGTLTLGTFAQVSGTTMQGGPVTPQPYIPLTLPAGRNLMPGATNVTLANFETRSLTPGAYGTLAFASGNTVNLTAGQYIFGGISNSFTLNKLSFDTSGGPINIFVAGNLNFNLVQVINGVQLFAGGTPNPLDSQKIFWEVGGNFVGNASIYGTIFTPNGHITMNSFADVTGRVLAGQNVTFNSGSVTVVPEPATLGMAAACGLLLLVLRDRRPAVVLGIPVYNPRRIPNISVVSSECH